MKLNLGCGQDIRPGYVNADLFPLPGVDLVLDMDILPWKWHGEENAILDDTFEEVRASHVLEHSRDLIKVVGELWRVCQHGALVHVEAPHFQKTALDVWGDPTHRSPMGPMTFHFWYPKMPVYGHQIAALSPARFVILAQAHSDYYLVWDLAAYKREDEALLGRHKG